MNTHTQPKKPTNLTLDRRLLEEARNLNVNLSQAAESGLRRAVAEAWLRENVEALASSNDWVARNSLPLEQYRRF
jgi:antitoxin CcdA